MQVRQLLKHGVEASFQREADGVSGLMVAAQRGNTALVSELLQAGAPWNALDRRGCCAGEYADAAGQQGTFDQLVQAGEAQGRKGGAGGGGTVATAPFTVLEILRHRQLLQSCPGVCRCSRPAGTFDQLVQAGGAPPRRVQPSRAFDLASGLRQ